jgi:hypothetical protein
MGYARRLEPEEIGIVREDHAILGETVRGLLFVHGPEEADLL